jgi:hypothetical protein
MSKKNKPSLSDVLTVVGLIAAALAVLLFGNTPQADETLQLMKMEPVTDSSR